MKHFLILILSLVGMHINSSATINDDFTLNISTFNDVVVNASNNGPLSCVTTFAQVSATSPSAGLTYFWTGPFGFFSNEQNPIVSSPGMYVVRATDQMTSCFSLDTTILELDIISPDGLAINDGPLTCTNLAIMLSVNSSIPSINYLWTGPNGFISTEQTPIVTLPGEYLVTITNSVNGCSTELSTLVMYDCIISNCGEDIIINCALDPNLESVGIPYFEGKCPLLPIPPSQLAPIQNSSVVSVTDITFNATQILGGAVISKNAERSFNICYNNFGDSLIIEGELLFYYQDDLSNPGKKILHGVSGRDLPTTITLSAGSDVPTVGGSQGEWIFQDNITGHCSGLEFEKGWFFNSNINGTTSISPATFASFIQGECYDVFFSAPNNTDPSDNFGKVVNLGNGVVLVEYDGTFPFRIAHKINNPNTPEIIDFTFLLTTDGASGGGVHPARTDSILIPVEFILIPNQVDMTLEIDSIGFNGICQNQVVGIIERRFIATDTCGLMDTCLQIITVEDITPPTITSCPGTIRIFDDNLDPINTGMPSSVDDCGFSTMVFDDSFISQSDCLDSIRREFTFIDNCGNENFCAQLIIVQDTTFQDLPFPITNDGPQTCDDQEVFLIADGNFDGFTLNWEGPADYSSTGDSSIASLAGIYYLKAIDSLTNCLFIDSTEVIDSCILPLDLVKFNANWFSESAAQINWETANEINIKYFELERSNDGFIYENISTFAALGNVGINTNYSHKDQNLPAGEQFYYRLKIEETDGTIFYSQVIVLRKELTKTVLFNAFNNTLSIENNSAVLKLNAVQIYNSIGQQVYARPMGILLEKGSHVVPLNQLNLNSGVYFLKVDFGNYQKVIRFFNF